MMLWKVIPFSLIMMFMVILKTNEVIWRAILDFTVLFKSQEIAEINTKLSQELRNVENGGSKQRYSLFCIYSRRSIFTLLRNQLAKFWCEWHNLDCKKVIFGRFRKAGSAISVILECEVRGRVRRENISVSHHSPSPFYSRSRPFVRIWSVARVRKKIRLFCSLGIIWRKD